MGIKEMITSYKKLLIVLEILPVSTSGNVQVKRMKEMIPNYRSSWLLNKLFYSALKEMFAEQYGEYAYWY